MRTERVTLEITRPTVCHYPAAAKNFVWWHLLRDVVQGERESVRVVPPGEADVEIRRIARDLEETRQQLFTAMEAVHERDAALARVVELEAAAKLAPAPNVGALRARRDLAMFWPHWVYPSSSVIPAMRFRSSAVSHPRG